MEKRQMDLRRQQLILELQLKEMEDEKKSEEEYHGEATVTH